MGWLNEAVPHVWQWVGLFATILGLLTTVDATVAAVLAAMSARTAREQAREARNAAIRLGDVLHLSDLLEDMQELQAILSRDDFAGLAAKAGTIRGRVQRFRRQQAAYELSTEETMNALDIAQRQLGIILKAAASWGGKPENRSGRIQIAVANAYESLSNAFAIQHAHLDKTEIT